MDWTYAKRRQPGKNGDRRKNGREKNKRKTTTDGLDDDQEWVSRAEGESATERGVATLDIRTCLRAENQKKKKKCT